MTLTEFLLARLEEDQVKRAVMREWHAEDCAHLPDPSSEYTYPCDCGVPERMEREVEAKRRIIEQADEASSDRSAVINEFSVGDAEREEAYASDPGALILKALASVYADHPDYDRSWAV